MTPSCALPVALLCLAVLCDGFEWDKLVTGRIAAIEGIVDPKPVAFPELAPRLKRLLQSHAYSHVQIFDEQDGQRTRRTDLYYGCGELHIVQHVEGWNLVTRGSDAYEWKQGSQTGEITKADPQELIEYLIYLTDPALFGTYLHRLTLREPDLFEPREPGVAGCEKWEFKQPRHSLHAFHLSAKGDWYGGIEFENAETGERATWVFLPPKSIDAIPDEVTGRIEGIRFRPSQNSLSRHRTYL